MYVCFCFWHCCPETINQLRKRKLVLEYIAL
uniref:Uncharacterized protein n=1 Tax=Arundo donax TaxID=35708 RepID=A0A0A8ZJ69_ARUDO